MKPTLQSIEVGRCWGRAGDVFEVVVVRERNEFKDKQTWASLACTRTREGRYKKITTEANFKAKQNIERPQYGGLLIFSWSP